jgi:hypothetical protein
LAGGIILAEQGESIEDVTSSCPECGAKLKSNAEICTKCGLIQPFAKQKSVPEASSSSSSSVSTISKANEKRPLLALLLAFFFLPAGYWYVKRLKRFVVIFVVALLIGELIGDIGVFIAMLLFLVAVYDVYKLAKNESAPFDFLRKWGL